MRLFLWAASQPLLDFIANGIKWHIVGDLTIDGKVAVKDMCDNAVSQGKANFQSGRVIKGENHILVGGAGLHTDMHYCGIYTIEQEQIMEITSYCLAGIE